jgi:hypothetical protein
MLFSQKGGKISLYSKKYRNTDKIGIESVDCTVKETKYTQ